MSIEKDIIKEILLDDFDYRFYIDVHLEEINEDPDKYREYFLNSPGAAYNFALWVDRYPRDDTRQVASKLDYYAYLYLCYIDGQYHKVTWEGVQKNRYYKNKYIEEVKVLE